MKRFPVLLAAAALVLAFAGQVSAGSPHWTQGEAQAELQTYPASGDRFAETPGLDIRPFQQFYGSVIYCANDWHVIALEVDDVEFEAPDGTIRTHEDVIDGL